MQELEAIRNISIIAHIDAGKTSTTEGMLFYTGMTHRFGNIDDGTTVMDYLPEERERGITIISAAASLEWKDHLVHLIDTPGHIDFTAEVERSLRVIDGAVVIFSGVEGVEAQSEKVWRQADKYRVPKIAFINKLDRIGACFQRVLDEINAKFGDCALPLHEPLGVEDQFAGVVDLLSLELVRFGVNDQGEVSREPLPPDLVPEMRRRRDAIVERLADASDEVATAYLDGRDLPAELLRKVIRTETIKQRLVPVLAGSAKKRMGIQTLLDAVIDFLPSPADVGSIQAQTVKSDETVELKPDSTLPFAGLVFKVVADPSADLLYLRTYAGTLRPNSTLCNSRTHEKVKVKQILRLFAKNTTPLEKVGPGDIVGIIGPKETGTGDTLCEPRRLLALEPITFPDPVISMAVEPRYSRDKDRLDEVLELLCREDPTLSRSLDEETGQRIISGMGELHLEIKLNRAQEDFHVEVRAGEPRVAYRETLKAATVQKATFVKTLGEVELFAGVELGFRPVPRGDQAFAVESRLHDKSAYPKEFVNAAVRALTEGLRTGGNHGYPLIYLAAELRDLTIHPEKTTEPAVVGAVLMGIDQAIREVGTTVLEPLMHLEILTPDDTVGEVSVYLQPRRAVIHEMASMGTVKRISCEVPLAEMFGFGKALPKLSGGRGSFSMEPCGYQELPSAVATRMFGTA